MDVFLNLLAQPFVWGLALGLLFFCLSLWSHFKTKGDLKRYRRMLSDKMEIEAEQQSGLKAEKKRLEEENENLRTRLNSTRTEPIRDLERELEIFARAERSMVVNAPGFAGAWESAKAAAADEVLAEDRGKSLPRRFFRKFFHGGPDHVTVKELPDTSGSSSHPAESEAEPATAASKNGDREAS